MADQEEDLSSLPLQDRFAHKGWKVRKDAYEAATQAFNQAQSEGDPVVRQFVQDASIWKGAVGDSNVAAQQEALSTLLAFLQISGTQGCTRYYFCSTDYITRRLISLTVQNEEPYNFANCGERASIFAPSSETEGFRMHIALRRARQSRSNRR